MAVYQGARQRGGLALPWPLPASTPDAGVAARGRERRPARKSARAGAASARGRIGGQRRVRFALAGIVVAFSVGFVSLSQSVQVAATSYDIVRLQSEHDRLAALQQELRSDVERLKGEPAVRKEALDAGLGQLGAAIVLPAR